MLSALQGDVCIETLARYDRDGDRAQGDCIPDPFAAAFSELVAVMDETRPP